METSGLDYWKQRGSTNYIILFGFEGIIFIGSFVAASPGNLGDQLASFPGGLKVEN